MEFSTLMRRRSASEPLRPCRWCAQPAGNVPLCSAVCFRLAAWVGWFDPPRLWARENNNSKGRIAVTEKQMETANYTDSGILFKNDRRTSDKAPDYKGNLDAACEKCGHRMHRTLAAWVRNARNGSKFLSLSFKPKADQQLGPAAQDDTDDVHF
jgi:hypothetical protein